MKPQNYSRLQTNVDGYGTTADRKTLHFWDNRDTENHKKGTI
jgi:hypothetical protein